MAYWLYQMTANKRALTNWSHKEYRATVCEREDTHYNVGTLRSKGGKIQPGDVIVLFYAPGGNPKDTDAGVCGWGVILAYAPKTIVFRPIRPSDYLKTKPIWDDTVKEIINEITGPVHQGNMWEIPTEPLTRLIRMIEPL